MLKVVKGFGTSSEGITAIAVVVKVRIKHINSVANITTAENYSLAEESEQLVMLGNRDLSDFVPSLQL